MKKGAIPKDSACLLSFQETYSAFSFFSIVMVRLSPSPV